MMEPALPDPSRAPARPGLFEAFGVEIEYAIVDRASLDVLPVADALLERVAGEPTADVERGEIAWSNELALHVLELKTNGPAASLAGLPPLFHAEVREANAALDGLGGCLLPGGVHPWMDPARESKLWPHEMGEVYRAFDRIFGCSGHGWTNLQSVHVNLPFQGDEEFWRLHAAIRLILPLAPALAASSPILEGRVTGDLDGRLVAYRGNARRVPSVAGAVVPEPVRSRAMYEEEILERIYEDLAPHDPEGVLRHEWVNARGAIARFERDTIEIRLLDAQESPRADIAVVAAVVDALAWVTETVEPAEADAVPTGELAALLEATTSRGEEAEIPDGLFRRALRLRSSGTARAAWSALLDRGADRCADPELVGAVERILSHGPLARRMLRGLGPSPDRARIEALARELRDALVGNALYG